MSTPSWTPPTPPAAPGQPGQYGVNAANGYPAPGHQAAQPPTYVPGSYRGPSYAPPAPGMPGAATGQRPGPVMEPPSGPPNPTLGPAWPNRPELERLLAGLVNNGGSDMHLAAGERPRFRISGALVAVADEKALSSDDISQMLQQALTEREWAEFSETNELDTAYQMDTDAGAEVTSRFRLNVFRSMDRVGVVARVIPTKILTLDQLGVLPQVSELAHKPRGLILICGPTGSGKSTTLAGLVDLINTSRDDRVFTFEDPIEFTHTSKRCLISHREVGRDTASFVEGLRRVRREDPDIILIGEMRDYETIDAAIEAADTGHLVLATLHTNSAAETISRIINAFPSERQNQVRTTLASVLQAVICQVLVPSKTPRGRVVATEIMMVTPGIRNNIRENDIPAISNALTDTAAGSISLDAHLAELVRQGLISRREADKKASSPENLARQLGH